jgi:Cu+-exporting ATPase
MQNDPVCGIPIEGKRNNMGYADLEIPYHFCSNQCKSEFITPFREQKKLKIKVAISVALTIPIIIFSIPQMLPAQFDGLFPISFGHFSNYLMMTLATLLQFWIGWRFYRGSWEGIKVKALNPDILLVLGTTVPYIYSVIVVIATIFPPRSVHFETPEEVRQAYNEMHKALNP